MTKQTLMKWVTLFNTRDYLTESEITTMKAKFNARYFNRMGGEVDSNLDTLITEFNIMISRLDNAVSITKEQTEKGINYLRAKTFKLNGELRKNCKFGTRELDIINDFKEFKFTGFMFEREYHNSYVPVYKVVSNSGDCFEYTGVNYDFITIVS